MVFEYVSLSITIHSIKYNFNSFTNKKSILIVEGGVHKVNVARLAPSMKLYRAFHKNFQ